ncbi:hypothetical protein HC026_06535 [Lactobacillus sp. LC28-10]|uniref:Extracellular zinc metalloproteinase n=1 Tax=Secundilactobacillus angelensis TaxID=2722706 RepID=A0ABX1KZD2_9LACO|nr:hypothetical protein [Secundilactobacillus angelensis]MCH5461741.1 hypothetical protein [Secundilactobacillus angelensis]NLR18580.1 hypothetical protein [Secundilactobacillus angelensis]
MQKLLFTFSLLIALLGGALVTSTSASAKSLPKLKTEKVTYASSRLNTKVTAPKSVKLLAVKYNHHTTYYKLKNKAYKLNYKFSGYKTFELYGTTSKHQRVTQIKKLSSSTYATTDVIDLGEIRTSSDATIVVHTLGTHRTVRVYSGHKLLQAQNTGSSKQATFKIALNQYKPKLTYTVAAANKKATRNIYIPYLTKPSNLDVIA